MYEWYARHGDIVTALYWIFAASFLFFVIALFRGTIRNLRNKNEPVNKQNIKDLGDRIDKSIQIMLNESKNEREILNKRMLEIIERMDRRIALLEERNGQSKPIDPDIESPRI